MTYRKPEVLSLGHASSVIQGVKNGMPPEGTDFTKNRKIADSELDD